jgi:hypothetical protein
MNSWHHMRIRCSKSQYKAKTFLEQIHIFYYVNMILINRNGLKQTKECCKLVTLVSIVHGAKHEELSNHSIFLTFWPIFIYLFWLRINESIEKAYEQMDCCERLIYHMVLPSKVPFLMLKLLAGCDLTCGMRNHFVHSKIKRFEGWIKI